MSIGSPADLTAYRSPSSSTRDCEALFGFHFGDAARRIMLTSTCSPLPQLLLPSHARQRGQVRHPRRRLARPRPRVQPSLSPPNSPHRWLRAPGSACISQGGSEEGSPTCVPQACGQGVDRIASVLVSMQICGSPSRAVLLTASHPAGTPTGKAATGTTCLLPFPHSIADSCATSAGSSTTIQSTPPSSSPLADPATPLVRTPVPHLPYCISLTPYKPSQSSSPSSATSASPVSSADSPPSKPPIGASQATRRALTSRGARRRLCARCWSRWLCRSRRSCSPLTLHFILSLAIREREDASESPRR